MTAVLDNFLLNALNKNQPVKQQKHLSVQSPLVTMDRFCEMTGTTMNILRGYVRRDYIPTVVIGRHRFVNLALLNRSLLGCGEAL